MNLTVVMLLHVGPLLKQKNTVPDVEEDLKKAN